METTKKDRDWLRLNWNAGEVGFQEWLAGSDRAQALVPRALRDVDTLEEALRAAEAAMDDANAGAGIKHGLCLFCPATEYDAKVGIVHMKGRVDHLDCPIVEARAVLGEE